jgi:hypothetical protein
MRARAAVVAEVLAHRDAGVRRDELQRRRSRRAGDDDRRVLHRAVLRELVDDLRDGRLLLADGDVEAEHALALLVDDRVDRDGGLAGLAVADDELALAAADRDHRVDRLDARSAAARDRLARDDARRLDLDAARCGVSIGPLPSIGLAERVDDAAEQLLADRHLGDAAGALDVSPSRTARTSPKSATPTLSSSRLSTMPVDAAGELDELAGHGASRP